MLKGARTCVEQAYSMRIMGMSQEKQSTDNLAERHRKEAKFFDDVKKQEGWQLARFYEWDLYRDAITASRVSLGSITKKDLLELGCGLGNDTVFFAGKGARVVTFDVSLEMVKGVAALVREKGLSQMVTLLHMSGEALAFHNESIDLVYGRSVIHHLDIPMARDEIYRVLRKGGKAVFLEPLGHNPLIALFRKLTPNRRTPDEKPLTVYDINTLAAPFSSANYTGWYLVSLLALVFCYFPANRRLFEYSLQILLSVDRRLLSWFPSLQRFCWVAVIELEK